MTERSPLHWDPSEGGYRARWSLERRWPPDEEFVIESVLDDESEEPRVRFLLRHGDRYVYRWTIDALGDSVQNYHYGLRAAMVIAERYRWEIEVEREELRNRRRAFLVKLFGIRRLHDEGFELWLRRTLGARDDREVQWEQLVEAEILRRLKGSDE